MFSWSNNTGRTSYPAARTPVVAHSIPGSIRPPQYTRSQHLESYLNDEVLKRSTRRISADDTTYDTVFQTTNGEALILRVHFPALSHSSAPCRCPAMTLVGVRASHPWLDSRMRVTEYSPIKTDEAWNSSRLMLGTAVHEVIKHLQLNPPQILEIADKSLQKLQRKLGNASASSSSQGRHPSHPPQHMRLSESTAAPPAYESTLHVPDVNMPTIPSTWPIVDSMGTEELQKLLDDEIDFLAFVAKLDIHEEIVVMRSSVLDDNTKVAEKNLETEARLKKLHQETTKLQEELQEKLKVFQDLEEKQNKICRPPDKADVARKLMAAKTEAFEVSEDQASDWLEDGGDTRAFLKTFLETRKKHHIRAAKIERLDAL